MMLREIVLDNFGGYKGRHVIDVTPPSESKPIILFGGLNGAGKTTLLDSLHLVLYGKRARCAGRGNLAYEEYLTRCIHRSGDTGLGAGVELYFEATFDGATSAFRVHRSWVPSGSGVTERLVVTRDGAESMLLTERWDEIVEELMPLDISSLFFFDGEKIEALADPERAGLVIATAVDSLLGLNLLERLSVDLLVLERKKRAIATDVTTRSHLAEIETLVESAHADHERSVQEQASRMNEIDRAESVLASAQQDFRLAGGELFEKKDDLLRRRVALISQVAEIQHRLVDLASGGLPLRLVGDLVLQVIGQRRTENEAKNADLMIGALAVRDEEMLSRVGPVLSPAAAFEIQAFLESDRATRAASARASRYLDVSDDVDQRLAFLWPNELDRVAALVQETLRVFEAADAELEEIERAIAAVPAADAVAVLSSRSDQARQVLDLARARYIVATEVADTTKRHLEDRQAARERAYREAAASVAGEEDARRIIEHAGRVRETLDQFRRSLLARHLSSIEAAVLDSLQRLLRKRRLISDLRLDPETFELLLFDRDGHRVSTERLSAGERQLLAVALLWGLARVSGKQLPTIVDTPLGRLDSTHRRLIAERYFPNASHQVLLLSTDEEIDESLLEIIRPAVGRCYELRYDDSTGSTTVVDGYFSEEAGTNVA